jgi:hypothetical protein
VYLPLPFLSAVVFNESLNVVDTLFEIFKDSQSIDSLKCLARIAAIPSNPLYDSSLNAILQRIFVGVVGLHGIRNDGALWWLSAILAILGPRLPLDLLRAISAIDTVLDLLVDRFTLPCIERFTARGADSTVDTIVQHLIDFWASIGRHLRPEQRPTIRAQITTLLGRVSQKYVEALIANGSDGNTLLESSVIRPIEQLAAFNVADIAPRLKQLFDERITDFTAKVQEEASGEMVIAILAQILTHLLRIRGPEVQPFQQPIVISLLRLAKVTKEWIHNGITLPSIEGSLTFFTKEFPVTVFLVPGLPNESLSSALGLEEGLEGMTSIIGLNNFLFMRMLITLGKFTGPSALLTEAIVALRKLHPDRRVLDEFLQAPLTLPFLEMSEHQKLHRLFFEALAVVSHPQHLLTQLMNIVWPSRLGPSDMTVAAAALAGVFRVATPERFFLEAFRWFFPTHSEELSVNMVTYQADSTAGICVLRLWRRVVSRKITFPPNSAHGVVLFHQSATLLTPYLQRALDLPELEYKGLHLCCVIFNGLLTGDYVPFEAFEIYRDLVFTNLLSTFVLVFTHMTTPQWDEFLSVPRYAMSFLGLFKTLFTVFPSAITAADRSIVATVVTVLAFVCRRPGRKEHILATQIIHKVRPFVAGPELADLRRFVLGLAWEFALNDSEPLPNGFGELLFLEDGFVETVYDRLVTAAEQRGAEAREAFDAFRNSICPSLPPPTKALRDSLFALGVRISLIDT